MKRILLVILILFLGLSVYFLIRPDREEDQVTIDEAVPKKQEIETAKVREESKSDSLAEEAAVPIEKRLEVPFISQAPFKVWDHLHDEACEEASILMIHHYLEGRKSVSAQTAEDGIQALVKRQNELFGYFESTTVEQTAQLVRDQWNYKTEIRSDLTAEAIKKHIVQGNPVILPAAGRELGNPHFRSPGPIYHMLVVVGYTKDKFITHDPGTQYGQNYEYSQEKLLSAVHDWNGGDVTGGQKMMLIVTK